MARRPPPDPFVDRTLDATWPLEGSDYARLWDDGALHPVDTDDWPVLVGSSTQYFVDDHVIASAHNLRRTVHQPRKHPDNPVVVPDQPWEGRRGVAIGPAMRDSETGRFRLWYRTHQGRFVDPHGRATKTALLYAESDDGLHWEKPHLGVFEWEGSTQNNILGAGMEGSSLFRDDNEPDPSRRYKALFNARGVPGQKKGVFELGVSPDGLRWTRLPEPLAVMSGGVEPGFRGRQVGLGDTNSLLYDEQLGRYVWHTKVFVGGKRARAMLESDDLVHWTRPRVILCADDDDPPDAQIYDLHPLPYDGLWIAPLRLYRWESFKQVTVQLAHSRDGRHWCRTAHRQTFLPLGGEDDWDADYNICAARFFADVGDEHWIYYTGSRARERTGQDEWQHRIGLAVMKRGRFVSVEGTANPAVVTTRPLDHDGGELMLNANAGRGQLRVGVLDESGREVAGLGVEDCVAVEADGIELTAAWRQHRGLSPGRHRLRFELRDAQLFSFRFQP